MQKWLTDKTSTKIYNIDYEYLDEFSKNMIQSLPAVMP